MRRRPKEARRGKRSCWLSGLPSEAIVSVS
jgi:hypothetical protein